MDEQALETGFDPSRRELCPDGACIGVIGPDGKCKECGTLSPNGPPPADTDAETPAETPEAAEAEERDATQAASEGDHRVDGDGFDPTARELCPDGACIGVIGPDGKCKECGRAAE